MQTDGFYNALRHDGFVWIPAIGEYDRSSGTFSGGGVYRLSPLSKTGRFFTPADGLADPYCYAIAVDVTGAIWVSHWHEEKGLSRLPAGADRWEQVLTSAEGIGLGGVGLATVGNFLFIGQNSGLVIHDLRSGMAYALDEAMGLPGQIVSDIYVIWVAAYTYSYAGGTKQNNTGLMRIERSAVEDLFRALAQDLEAEPGPTERRSPLHATERSR